MQEHVVHDSNINEPGGGPNVVPADVGGVHPFPGTEAIESPDGGQGLEPRKPSWAERRAAKRATDSGVSAGGFASWLSWDLRAKLAVVLSFVILVSVLIWNRPWLRGKDTKPKGTLVASIPNGSPKDPSPAKGDGRTETQESAAPNPQKSAPGSNVQLPAPAAEPLQPSSDSPPALPNDEPKDTQKLKMQDAPPSLTKAPQPSVGKDSPPSLGNDSPPELPVDAAAEKEKKDKTIATLIEDAPPQLTTSKKQEQSKAPTDSPPSIDSPPKLGDAPAKPVEIESAPAADTKPSTVTQNEQPKVESNPETQPNTMPQLAPTPPATEAPKEPVAASPASEASSGGGYSIPNAGLIRANNVKGPKNPPISNETVLASAPATARAVPSAAAAPSESPDDTVHIVRRGENFWTIAGYHYGSGRRFYKALWYANRDLAKTPEDLYVGTPIRIPAVEDLNREYIEAPKTARSGAASPAAEATPTVTARDPKTRRVSGQAVSSLTTLPPAAETEEMKLIPKSSKLRTVRGDDGPKFRTYVVRGRNETLRSIAARELGDAEREDDLFRLNQKEFEEDSTKLRVGMTLKIPQDTRNR